MTTERKRSDALTRSEIKNDGAHGRALAMQSGPLTLQHCDVDSVGFLLFSQGKSPFVLRKKQAWVTYEPNSSSKRSALIVKDHTSS